MKNNPKIHQYHYYAYLINLGLIIPQSNLFLPHIIQNTKLQNRIIKIIPDQKTHRKIIMKVNSKEALRLLEIKVKSKKQKYQIFQNQDYATVIETERIYNIKMNYIINNAVKRGLAKEPDDYKWLIINHEADYFVS